MANTENPTPATSSKQRRKKGFLGLFLIIILAASGASSYWYFIASRYITTDNAYVTSDIAEVTPAVSGIVEQIYVVDTQKVRKGDILVRLQDDDAKLALAQAQAELSLAERRVRSYFANNDALTAMVDASKASAQQAKAQLTAAKTEVTRAQIDLQRREDLRRSGSISAEELTNARLTHERAQANLTAAQAAIAQTQANTLSAIGSLNANAALIAQGQVETNPEVLLAQAKVAQAQLNLERTVIRAPIDGVIAKRQVQIGRQVQAGMSLMKLVPLSEVYVEANFKEIELRNVKIGQPVSLISDLYGDKVRYQGTISGFSAGTGAAFALIPAQNATGNWIKVIQRLPVRIEIESDQLADYPLQVGLSMHATIDTATHTQSNQ